MNKKPCVFLGILLSLVLVVIVYLVVESLSNRGKGDSAENDFQQVVHGVGLGATAKPTWCYINFDPRIDPRCPCIEWPIPGGYCYCPDHTGTVSYVAGNIEMGAAIEIIKK
ncbi:hypothetical protein B188_25370 [Candidatus Brocadiaceae bacterium B188]|nr:hypothetical protein [Candidatus Brocadia sapporoensis]MEB2307961.1 hypothetical protein [Candidatus Brocadiaceae bacterium]QQR65781.1 MAG: hypothetical protein IPI25_09425 [Candidatus Brocadia sp.]RZV59718.1 MAG: hypothetical protein EX330_00645 [Candidatus Brocadia sp. BROELEC01]TWU50108.1 hypothetical protein B188_25370 [Candidatus Brocadiaceae bacterium B188]